MISHSLWQRRFGGAPAILGALPQVESAALVNVPPLQERSNASFVMAPATSAPEDQPLAAVRIISPGYFQTLRTPLLMGRFFDRRDVGQTRRVAIVTREFADKFFADQDPLGKLVATYLSSGECNQSGPGRGPAGVKAEGGRRQEAGNRKKRRVAAQRNVSSK